RPNRRCSTHWVTRIPAKREIARAQGTAQPVGESERLRTLRERNPAGGTSHIPKRMFSGPLVRNASSDFAAKDVEIKLKIGPFFVEPREVDGNRLKVEAVREVHSADGEAIFLPFRRPAQLRECLSD